LFRDDCSADRFSSISNVVRQKPETSIHTFFDVNCLSLYESLLGSYLRAWEFGGGCITFVMNHNYLLISYKVKSTTVSNYVKCANIARNRDNCFFLLYLQNIFKRTIVIDTGQPVKYSAIIPKWMTNWLTKDKCH
jgi:hypothetical protein